MGWGEISVVIKQKILSLGDSDISSRQQSLYNTLFKAVPGGGGVLPYMGYIGMCGPKG